MGLALGIRPPATAHAQDESWLIGQVNALRAELGLSGLAPNGQLSAAAAQHSSYMATTCDVSHTESNGSTPSSRAAANGYPGSQVNENIYGGAMAEASNAWSFWVNSGVHYQAMVDARINEVGAGVASGPCGHFFTMLVGYNDGVSAPPAPEQPADAAPAEAADTSQADTGAPATAIVIAPTQQPYVPPPPSRTPSATIPTLTPSATWTITPTRTPSPTGTVQPPNSTPIVLPTVPIPGQATAVALAALPTTEPSPSPTSTPSPTEPPPIVQQQAASGAGFEPRDLLPVALAGQVVLIGVVGFVYFRRQQR